MVKKPVVLIGLLSYKGEFHPEMVRSLDNLVRRSHAEGVDLAIKKRYGSVIPRSRNLIACSAVDIGSTHLLFIDSDMVFDNDALLRLLALDRDVISGLCVTRGEPYAPAVKKKDDKGIYRVYQGLEDQRFRSDADAVGAAFLLIKTDVLRKLQKPYFAMPPDGDGVMGEDIYFCKIAKEAGFDICVDASLIIGHICDRPMTIHDYVAYKGQRETEALEKEAHANNG